MMQGIYAVKRTALPNENGGGCLCDGEVRCGCHQALVCGVVKLRLATDATPAEAVTHTPHLFSQGS
jgi:hypothetical protein